MYPVMEAGTAPVKLKLDEENSLVFEVKIEGDAPASAPVYRLVCETQDVALSFRGQADSGGVKFIVPALQGRLSAGSYDAHLEVVIENRLIIPMQLTAQFDESTKVVVESVKVEKTSRVEAPVQTAAAKLIKVEQGKTTTAAPKRDQSASTGKKPVTLRELFERKKSK